MTFDEKTNTYTMRFIRKPHYDEPRTFKADQGLVSIDEKGGIYGGCKSIIREAVCKNGRNKPYALNWRQEERAELADLMIERWTRFKQPHPLMETMNDPIGFITDKTTVENKR
jgi:hypothetical protein